MVFEAAEQIGKKRGLTPEQVSNAFILNNKIPAAIIGTYTKYADLSGLIEAADILLAPEDMDALLYPWTTNNPLYKGIKRKADAGTLSLPGAKGDLTISKVICGTSNIGSSLSEDASFAVLDAYYQAGGRTIDTAKVYGSFAKDGLSHAELCVGKWVRARGVRHEVTLITKGCHPAISAMDVPRVNAFAIDEDIKSSLSSLGVDTIDIYQLHRDNPETPVANIMDCLHKHVESGEIRAIAASNWSVDRIEAANAYAGANGKTPFTSSEINFSLGIMKPGSMGADIPEVTKETLEYYRKHNLPILAWSSLAGGYLLKGVKGELDKVAPMFAAQFGNPGTKWRIRNVKAVMRDSRLSSEELCIAYVTCNAVNCAAIAGASSPAQMQSLMTGANLYIPPEIIEDLEYLPKSASDALKKAFAGGTHPLEEPFDWDTPIGDMLHEKFRGAISDFADKIEANPMAAAFVQNISFKQMRAFPGAGEMLTEDLANRLLSALNEIRTQLLEKEGGATQ
jgi:aryl-alcohol dehydrogenase-like predicted oxidoreductase